MKACLVNLCDSSSSSSSNEEESLHNGEKGHTALDKEACRAVETPRASTFFCEEHDDDDDDDSDEDFLLASPIFRHAAWKAPYRAHPSTTSEPAAAVHRNKTNPRTNHKNQATNLATKAVGASTKRHLAEEKARQKAEATRAKKLERAAQKEEKIREQQAATKRKQEQLCSEQQTKGTHAHHEIALLLDNATANTATRDASINNDNEWTLICKGLETPPEKESSSSSSNSGYAIHRTHPIQADSFCRGHMIRWIRKDHVLGGAKSAIRAFEKNAGQDVGVERMDVVGICFSKPAEFLELLRRNAAEKRQDDYPRLRQWLHQCQTHLSATWEREWPHVVSTTRRRQHATTSRIVLVLHKVQEEVSRQWTQKCPGAIRLSELNDAVVWLLLLLDDETGTPMPVECHMTSTVHETVQYLSSLTRALSEVKYYQDATELDCIKKIKSLSSSSLSVEDGTTNHEKDGLDVACDTWIKQLQMLPRMSEAKAQRLVQHYPTARSLMDAYENPNITLHTKRSLVAPLCEPGRSQEKLSHTLFELMTSLDPEQLLL